MFSVCATMVFVRWHMLQYPDMTVAFLALYHPALRAKMVEQSSSRPPVIHDPVSLKVPALLSNDVQPNSQTLTRKNSSRRKRLSMASASKTRSSSSTVEPMLSTSPSVATDVLLSESDEPDMQAADDDSSDGDLAAVAAADYQDEDSDDDVDEDDLREQEDDGEDDSSFPFGSANDVDSELGDLNAIKLRDVIVRIPAFIDKSIHSNNLVYFVLEVHFPNGLKRVVERLYTDFVRLRKYFGKTIPQCKVQLAPSFLPKKKANAFAMGSALEQRRVTVENYLRGLLLDEVVAKLGYRDLLMFLKQKTIPVARLRTTSISNGRKRFFGSSFSGHYNSGLDLSSNANVKQGILMKWQWRTCMNLVRAVLDRPTGTLSLYCRSAAAKEAHCVICMEDIEDIIILTSSSSGASPSSASTAILPPIPHESENYYFFEITTTTNDSYYLGGTKDQVMEWVADIQQVRTQLTNVSDISKTRSATLRTPMINRNKRKMFDAVNAGDSKIVLNHKKLVFRPLSADNQHPCALVSDLLDEILSIFQEYTDSKCVFTTKVTKRLQVMGEHACALQQTDLSALSTHAERLSF
jgi:hypothetical protein